MARRRSVGVRMRLLLLLVIAMLALAACGGGDDDDGDDDAGDGSPTVTTASGDGSGTASAAQDGSTATAGSTASVGGEQKPTSTVPAASPTATATATIEPTATTESTPTRVPATVAATPRIIATRPPDVVQAPPTPTPEPGTQWIIDESFDDGTSLNFPIGENASTGSTTQIDQGWYGISVLDQSWEVGYANQAGRHNNGVLGADATIVGNGEAGLVARLRVDDDGGYSFLLCSVYSNGAAGCWTNEDGVWTEIGAVPPGTIPQAETYRMIMVTYVAEVLFTVNDIEVGYFEVDMPEEGFVGMYSASAGGESTAWFDYFLFGIGTTAE